MRLLSILLTIVVTLACGELAYSQDAVESGLYFSSHEVITDNRTSLNLTPQEPFHFKNGFSIEFEAKFRRGDGHYGNIFRIIGNEEVNIDLVSNLASPSSNFWLILKDQVIFSYKWEDIPNGAFDQWMKIKVSIDTKNSLVLVSLNELQDQKQVEGIANLEDFNVVFGACKDKLFLNTDVCPMTLNNVLVYGENGRPFRNWKLTKHARNKVFDEIAYAEADVLNPNWQIDKHIHWKNDSSLHINNLVGVAKDETSGRIFLVNDQAVYIFHSDTSRIDTINFASGKPFPCRRNHLLYNRFANELWSYNFESNLINAFDFDTREWSFNATECVEPDFWHHNRLISPVDTSLVTFGGYGHYLYKSIIHQLDPTQEKWLQIDVADQIYPRYLSAAGLLNDQKALIYGGFGSKSGRQELSPEFYYDLYALDLQDFSVEKLWTLNNTESPFVACETLLSDSLANSFYTLVYNRGNFETSLNLVSFGIDEPEKQVYADSIPYKFLDTGSWATFFLDKNTSELITITTHESDVDIFSLAYPPLLPADVYQSPPVKKSVNKVWLGIGLIVLLSTFLYVIFRKKLTKKAILSQESTQALAPVSTDSQLQTQKRLFSAIYFLGGFQVFDKVGADITSEFTPTIKQLFLIIYLSTLKNGKGVSSITLKDTLWFDKSETKARNNRNVNISKLRALLDKIGNVVLDHDSTYWQITLDKDVYCDYANALALIKKSKSSTGLSRQEIFQLIQTISSGELCPNAQTEWMDDFKADFANIITDTLLSISNQRADVRSDKDLLLQISDCILQYDILNEEAIAIKCSTLYQLGKKGLAKHSYDTFCRDYKNMLGIDFQSSFNDLSHQNFAEEAAPLKNKTTIE